MPTLDLDLKKILENFDRRLHTVEQVATSPAVMGTPDTEIGDDGFVIGTVPFNIEPPDVVTDVFIEVGTYFDAIFADVEWILPETSEYAVTYELILFDESNPALPEVVTIIQTPGTNYRFDNLKPDWDYSVQIIAISRTGIRGDATARVPFSTGKDLSVPPAVSNVQLARGATSVVVKFDPLTVNQAPDVANAKGVYRVELSTNAFFTNVISALLTTSTIIAFPDIIAEGTYHARVAAIDSSGNQGPWAVSTPYVAGGIVDSMIVAGLSAAKITVGTMDGDRIAVNTLSAQTLESSSITSQTITLSSSGILRAGNTSYGVYFTAQGIRAYKNGVQTFVLDVATGDATFKGLVDAANITASAFNWGSGVLDSMGMRIYAALDSSTSLGSLTSAKSVSFIKGVANYDLCWSMWAPNYGTLRIDRVNRGLAGTGTLSDMAIGCRVLTLCHDSNGTSVASIVWRSPSSDSTFTIYGSMYATYKPFIIDHPSDPENKFLQHAALEGPEDGVFYRGKATTQDGKVTVELPDYFDDLIVDYAPPTVQITPIYSGGIPAVLETTEVVDGKFTVYEVSGANGARSFFWQVNAAREGVRGGEYEAVIDKQDLQAADEWITAIQNAEDDVPVESPPLTTIGRPTL